MAYMDPELFEIYPNENDSCRSPHNWCTHLSIAFDEATKSHLSQSRSSPCMCFTCHSWDFSVRKHRSHWTHLISVYGTRSCARHMWFEKSANVLNITSQPDRVHLNTSTFDNTNQYIHFSTEERLLHYTNLGRCYQAMIHWLPFQQHIKYKMAVTCKVCSTSTPLHLRWHITLRVCVQRLH